FSDNDKAILAEADAMIGVARTAMATQQIHQWLNAVWSVVAEANRYFAGEAPWALAKTDPARQHTVLYVTAEVIRQIAILTQPVAASRVRKACRQPRHSPGRGAEVRSPRRQVAHCAGHNAACATGSLPPLHRADGGINNHSCSSTAIAIWIFRISPPISTPSWRGRRTPASAVW